MAGFMAAGEGPLPRAQRTLGHGVFQEVTHSQSWEAALVPGQFSSRVSSGTPSGKVIWTPLAPWDQSKGPAPMLWSQQPWGACTQSSSPSHICLCYPVLCVTPQARKAGFAQGPGYLIRPVEMTSFH